jgi:deazaflavin-dependent oxidoreductase (nitroreductase family)
LTTIGHKTQKPRTIEIWFVLSQQRIYLLAEHGFKTHWVQNIQANSEARIQIGQHRFLARGRILDDARDHQEWQAVADLSRQKYGWSDGLPVAFEAYLEEKLENG